MNILIISLSLIIISNFAHTATAQHEKASGLTLAMKVVSNPAASGSSQSRLTVTPDGRAAVASAPDGGAFIAWVEKGEKQSRLLARYAGPDGRLGPPILITQSTKSFPRLARLGDQAMLTWTAAGSTRTAFLSVQAQSAAK